MSKVVKGIKKVFKKVTKVVKKVLPIALAVGALVFTGGAALGVAGFSGGWGAAVSGVVSKLGAGSVLSSALTGAITQAGYGALIGGVVSKVQGGSFSQGAQMGALGGAVSGGIMGGLGMATDPLAGIGTSEGAAAAVPNNAVAQSFPVDVGGPVAQSFPVDMGGAVAPAGAGATVAGTGAPVGAASGNGGLLSNVMGQGGWMERNQGLVGGLIKGVGQGLIGSASADSEAKAQKDLLQERYRLQGANYAGTDPGANYRMAERGEDGQTPSQRFDPRNYGSWRYEYNQQTGKIERVPVSTA